MIGTIEAIRKVLVERVCGRCPACDPKHHDRCHELYKQEADDIAKLFGWIPIGERIPGDLQRVLVSNGLHTDIAIHLGDGRFTSCIPVAYWIPMPALPEES